MLQQLGHRYETVELDIPLLELDDGSHLPESNAIPFYRRERDRYLPDDRRSRAEVGSGCSSSSTATSRSTGKPPG